MSYTCIRMYMYVTQFANTWKNPAFLQTHGILHTCVKPSSVAVSSLIQIGLELHGV